MNNLISTISLSLLFLTAYIIGLYLNVRIIRVSIKDQSISWKMDVTNSIILIFHYAHSILMHVITNIVPNLYIYTGKWFCYFSKFLAYSGNLNVQAQSFIIAMMNFVVIVHWKSAKHFGHANVKTMFFWINVLYPFFMQMLHLLSRPDFYWAYDGFSQIDRCLGDPKNTWGPDSNRTQTKLHNLCLQLNPPPMEDHFPYTIFLMKSGLCWSQFSVIMLIMWNIFEMAIYCRIFGFMHR